MQTQHLQPKLKALRLGGMLDTLDLRLAEAERGKVGYLAFLELLLEDEISRRTQKMLALRVHKARFEEHATLATFDFGFNPTIPAALIYDLASCHYLERHESVLICGPVGVGKSHIGQGLGLVACEKGYDVLYMKTSRLLADLAGGHADGTWAGRLRRYVKPDLLILDDFGLREFTALQAEDLYELICERDHRGSLVVLSNRAAADWYPLFPNPVVAEGALDRLINSAHHVLMTGRSYRPLRRPDRAARGPLGEEVTPPA